MNLLLLIAPALAYSGGITARTSTGCTCHSASADATTSASFAPASTVILPGDTINVQLLVSTTNGAHTYGGLDVSTSGGTLSAGSNTRASAGEITHSAPTAMTSGTVTFNFSWTAPASEGTYTLKAAGNAVNKNGANTGDGWNFAPDLVLTVDDGCDDLDRDGYENCGGDCDDADATLHPYADEHCDGIDEDCDGVVDDSPVDGTTWYADTDSDGYGGRVSVLAACDSPGATWTTEALDCDDTEASVNPEGVESCNGWDDDCDGTVDEADATDASSWYLDSDGDGYGDPGLSTPACAPPPLYVADATDCNDRLAGVNPGASEICDPSATDEDCNSLADDADPGVTGRTTWYLDADSDGYGGSTSVDSCVAPASYGALGGDCNDADVAYHPGATEICGDPVDLNCDGLTGTTDADSDGYAACAECDDGNSAVHPGATEACNGYDDDCNGSVDEGEATGASTWYADSDGDGFGDPTATVLACATPDSYVDNGDDCADGDPTVFPGASDPWYDGTDSDCAGDSDFDADHDSYDSAKYGGADCDDARADTYPGAPDTPYDGVVTDCNGADEYDVDGDGYDSPADCDDANSDIHPDATETWYDGIDQDCDGNDTDQDGDGVAAEDDCDDTDASVAADCSGDTGDSGDTATDSGDSGTDSASSDDTGDTKASGCGCAADPAPALGSVAALLAAAALGRRRRTDR